MAKARNIIEPYKVLQCDILMMLMPQYLKRLYLRYLRGVLFIVRARNDLIKEDFTKRPFSLLK